VGKGSVYYVAIAVVAIGCRPFLRPRAFHAASDLREPDDSYAAFLEVNFCGRAAVIYGLKRKDFPPTQERIMGTATCKGYRSYAKKRERGSVTEIHRH
jgi:hypothetical protein